MPKNSKFVFKDTSRTKVKAKDNNTVKTAAER